MKLYSFSFQDWGVSYHVMSDSKANALKAIKSFVASDPYTSSKIKLFWKKATVSSITKSYIYRIIDRDMNEVLVTESS